MSWKKYFNPVENSALPAGVAGDKSGNADMYASRYSSWLPEVYQGSPDRVMRYYQYDAMDRDLEVNAALDIISEFCTQEDDDTKLPFLINYNDQPSSPEVKVIQQSLQKWCNLNELPRRIFKMFRSTVKYGDQVYIRDPQTKKLYWVDPYQIEKVLVNESNGKKIEQYFIKNLDLHLKDLAATSVSPQSQRPYGSGAIMSDYTNPQASSGFKSSSSGFGPDSNNAVPIDAQHVLHISMSEGMETTWPFGNSILDPVFKIFKQKELLEDAIIIYRVHRAPERRVFFIDVGNMPPHKAQQYLERVKYEVQQKRIPNKTGGGQNVADSSYNPMSMLEDYFFAQTADGRGSKVDTLPGGDNLGEIDDLKFFNNKLIRGLRIPSSYLPTGPDDGSAPFNDGKVGVAYIQEYRFAKYCERLQRQIIKSLNQEFKVYLKASGVEVDNSLFDITFTDPQNFSSYRELELDQARTQLFGALEGIPYLATQFKLKKYLGLTEEEIARNETLWAEENAVDVDDLGSDTTSSDLRQVGVRPQPAGDVSMAPIDMGAAEPGLGGDIPGGNDAGLDELNTLGGGPEV
jgi:hypothetical protein|tara:strand:- start:537 stop:2255 length:1719 start_codon:yes stop_codon:yes gene_type:complete